MTDLNAMAAEILEASAAGYASAAVALLQGTTTADGSRAWGDAATWKASMTQQILELAAAVRVGEPALFAQRITWCRRALQARGRDQAEMSAALLSLRAALDREMPAKLRPTVEPSLALAIAALDKELEPSSAALDPKDRHGRLGLDYIAACLEGDPDRAIRLVLDTAAAGMPADSIYTRILIPAQKEVGQLWHVGDVSIAEEHLVSETTRQLMTLLAARYAPAEPAGLTVLAAAVAGNTHDLGLRGVADLFRLAGWRCLFLGANVPAAEIARAAQAFDVDLIVLNATLTTQLKDLADSVTTLKHAAPRAKVMVGGLALEDSPQLWKQLGADGYAASVDSAVAAGRRLVAG